MTYLLIGLGGERSYLLALANMVGSIVLGLIAALVNMIVAQLL